MIGKPSGSRTTRNRQGTARALSCVTARCCSDVSLRAVIAVARSLETSSPVARASPDTRLQGAFERMTCHVAQRPLAGLQVVKSQVDPEHRPAETRDRSGCPLRRKTQRGAVLCSGSDVLALT